MPLAAIVSSPLDRCLDTAGFISEGRDQEIQVDERVVEVRYGDWTGVELKTLYKQPMWKVVQSHPSAAVFPNGEALAAVSARAVSAVREWNDKLGPDATYLICSHGDVIKALLADALGMHLDAFQRIQVDPCSVSVVNYTETRPFVVRANDTGGSVESLIPPKKKPRKRASSDGAVGGGAG